MLVTRYMNHSNRRRGFFTVAGDYLWCYLHTTSSKLTRVIYMYRIFGCAFSVPPYVFVQSSEAELHADVNSYL